MVNSGVLVVVEAFQFLLANVNHPDFWIMPWIAEQAIQKVLGEHRGARRTFSVRAASNSRLTRDAKNFFCGVTFGRFGSLFQRIGGDIIYGLTLSMNNA